MVKNIPFGYGAGQILTHRWLQIMILGQADVTTKNLEPCGRGKILFQL
jgi:hypothetical protein